MLIIAETPRLIVRNWQPQDLQAYCALMGDKVIAPEFRALKPSCRAENELWRYQAELDKRGWSRWAVVSKSDFKLIGYCGFAPYGDDVEMSWCFLPEYLGVDLVVEAAEAVARFGFEKLGFERIISFTVPDNDFCQTIMRQLGMSLECCEGWSSCIVARYSILSPLPPASLCT